jgi:hypothetical protein
MRPQLVQQADDDRVVPHSLDAERAVLGAVLVQPALLATAHAVLDGASSSVRRIAGSSRAWAR